MSKDENKPFDLASLDPKPKSEAGVDLTVLHPDSGQPLGITITLRGMESEAYKRAFRAQVNKRLSGRQQRASVEEMEAEALGLLADCTVGWAGVVLDGAELPFSHSNAVALYGRFGWLRKQVDAFISEEANYRQD